MRFPLSICLVLFLLTAGMGNLWAQGAAADEAALLMTQVTETLQQSRSGNRSITVETGNLERKVSAGKVTDQIALSHEETVGMSYKLTAMKQDFQASAMVTIVGGLVKINS